MEGDYGIKIKRVKRPVAAEKVKKAGKKIRLSIHHPNLRCKRHRKASRRKTKQNRPASGLTFNMVS
jgi:hypothetical protein